MLATVCNATDDQLTQVQNILPPIVNGAIRCVDAPIPLNITCADGRVLDVPFTYEQLNATNATANATGAAGSGVGTAAAGAPAGEMPGALPLASEEELAADAAAVGTTALTPADSTAATGGGAAGTEPGVTDTTASDPGAAAGGVEPTTASDAAAGETGPATASGTPSAGQEGTAAAPGGRKLLQTMQQYFY
jgi:hypothetical protein